MSLSSHTLRNPLARSQHTWPTCSRLRINQKVSGQVLPLPSVPLLWATDGAGRLDYSLAHQSQTALLKMKLSGVLHTVQPRAEIRQSLV